MFLGGTDLFLNVFLQVRKECSVVVVGARCWSCVDGGIHREKRDFLFVRCEDQMKNARVDFAERDVGFLKRGSNNEPNSLPHFCVLEFVCST